jgi:ferrous iron transport protein A
VNLFGRPGPRRPRRHPVPPSDQSAEGTRASTLARQPVGSRVVLGRPLLGAAATRRLGELGLRAGTAVVVLHRTAGRGCVVAAGDTRIALDRATLEAWPVEDASAPGGISRTHRVSEARP